MPSQPLWLNQSEQSAQVCKWVGVFLRPVNHCGYIRVNSQHKYVSELVFFYAQSTIVVKSEWTVSTSM